MSLVSLNLHIKVEPVGLLNLPIVSTVDGSSALLGETHM